MLINISKTDSNVRVLCGTLLIATGTHWLWYLFIPLGLLLLQMGVTSKCPITHLLQRQTAAAQENLFINFLPKFNPQPVFIFNRSSQLIFANGSAKQLFPNIKKFQHLIAKDTQRIIEQELVDRSEHTIANGHIYSLLFRGSAVLDGIVVYGTDITEVVNLNQEIFDTQKEIIYAMGEIGETRSKETGDHVRRVAEYSELLALLAGIGKTEAELIKLASPMHDIGKIGIADAILKKPGKLTEDEFTVMKTHAQLGFNMLNHSNRPVLKTAAIIAHQHHEKWDGSGYPQQLAGKDIHIYGRITAVADVFDALGSARVYKEAWPLEKIISLFKDQRTTHFDPFLVDLLLDNLPLFLDIRKKHPN